MKTNFQKTITILFAVLFLSVSAAFAQVTEFTYQGSLKDNAAPANANYDFEFALFDSLSGGSQIGATIPKNSVLVTNGVFAVKLDFGSVFPGANRYLETHVRLTGQPGFTTLTPRQLVNSAPYSVKSLNADNATNATNATQLGGVAASQYVLTGDSRMSDTRMPTAGSANYIQNQGFPTQPSSNFSISGWGIADRFSALTAYYIGNGPTLRVLSMPGSPGLQSNIAVGLGAGFSNTTGENNGFFGVGAGGLNTTGFNNGYFGAGAGNVNTTGSRITTVGASANVQGTNLTNATAIGADTLVSQSNSLILGSINTINGATADTNVGIGTTAPSQRLHVVGNGLFTGNLTVNNNVGIGTTAPLSRLQVVTANDTSPSTITAWDSRHFVVGGTASTGGIGMSYDQTNNVGYFGTLHPGVAWGNLVLQSGGGNVGIGTTSPLFKFHVKTGTDQNIVVRPATDLGGTAGIGLQSINDGNTQYKPLDLEGSQVTLNVGSAGNVGIGTPTPTSKLHVTGGNVYIAQPNSLIITSPNGACWFITVNNAGALSTISVTCP